MKIIFSVFSAIFVSWVILFPGEIVLKISFLVVLFLSLLTFFYPFLTFNLYLLSRPLFDPLWKFSMVGINILSLLGISLILIPIVVFLKTQGKLIIPRTPIRLLIVLCFVSFLSFINTHDVFQSLEGVFKIGTIVAIYIIAYNYIKRKEDGIFLIKIMVFSSIIPIIIGVIQILTNSGIYQGGFSELRINSLFIFSNTFARFLATNLILILSIFFLTKTTSISKICYSVIFYAGFICLVKTYTISAWVAFAIGIFIMAAFNKTIRKFGLISFILILLFFPGGISARINSVLRPSQGGMTSIRFREEITRELLQNAIPKHPILGFGVGTSMEVGEKQTSFGTLPHNDFIRIFVEMGIVGFGLYTIFMVIYFTKAFLRIFLRRKYHFYDIVFFSLFAGYFIASFGSNIFSYVVTSGYLFCCFGIWDKFQFLDYEQKK